MRGEGHLCRPGCEYGAIAGEEGLIGAASRGHFRFSSIDTQRREACGVDADVREGAPEELPCDVDLFFPRTIISTACERAPQIDTARGRARTGWHGRSH